MIDQGKVRPVGRFLGALLVVWILAWLPLGLAKGDPDYVLTAISRHTVERQVYQGLLYSGLLLVFLDAWRRHAPERPRWGKPSDILRYAALGLVSALMLRALLTALGGRPVPNLEPDSAVWLVALVSAFAVALVEEALFRGFLLGHLAQAMGPPKAVATTSLLFAAVHLFRPGDATFRVSYGLGLFLLAVLLARIAWTRQSIGAAVGMHAGIILPNLLDPWQDLRNSWWSGWQSEPASGALSWVLTLALWGQWEWWQSRRRGPLPDDVSATTPV